jgi:serine/threonine protein kinase/Tol biopolymer transport system component
MPLSSGDKLGPYSIVAPIGAGGMGEVYRARDSRLGRDVAIKVLPDAMTNDAQALARFEREARAVAALSHPNILVLFDVGADRGIHYAVTELLEGETLRERLSRSALPWRKTIELGVALAEGLAAAHDKDIVHRDIKPGNIFLTNDGQVKILDFGLVLRQPSLALGDETVTSGNTELGAVMGTVGYMSPEQARGEKADARSDIFSLGCVLYEAVTGRRPFQGKTAADTLAAILKEDPPTISDTGKQVPAELERVIERCLAKNAAQRFHSAHDLAFALRVLTSVGGEKPGVVQQAPQKARGPLPMTIAAAVVILAALGLFYWLRNRPLPPPRISSTTQITHDGLKKYLAGTDGSRLYFTEASAHSLGQVAVSGGEIAQMPVPVPGFRYLLDISPDGTNMLVEAAQEKNTLVGALWIVPILGGSARRLGEADQAAFSPDGKSVAYRTQEGALWIVQSDGRGAHQLTAGPRAFNPSWSPDGGVLRYHKDGALWEISSNGSNPHKLLPDWRGSVYQCCGRWTLDGKFFLFLSYAANDGNSEMWALDERRGLFRKPPKEPIRLTTGPIEWSWPVPGKDGREIFSEGQISRGELVRFDLRNKQLQPFLGGISAEYVEFSKDGRYVVYVSYPEGILWRANRDGSGRVQLTDSSMYPLNPHWSPDGSQILFMDMDSHGAVKSYVVSSEGGGPQRIMPEDNGFQSDPGWSPDGRKIVFSNGGLGNQGIAELRVLDIASHSVTVLPGSAGIAGSPRWSPDGRYIAATSTEHPSLQIYDTKTQQWSVLLKIGQNTPVDYPVWSRDSRSIYFLRIRGDRGVYRVNLNGGEPERIADLSDVHLTGYFRFSLSLDPDDAPLLTRDVGSSDIYALTLDEK